MAGRTTNTPLELWPKVLKALLDVREAAAENGAAKHQADINLSLRMESQVMNHLGEPVDQMLGGFGGGAPSQGQQPFAGGSGGGQAVMAGGPGGGGMGGGMGGPPGQPPNPDELRRALSI